MNEEQKRILEMLSAGKVTVAEADRLLKALDEVSSPEVVSESSDTSGKARPKPRYLCVKIDSNNCDDKAGPGDKVDVRIPLGLVRAGIKLGSVMPERAKARVNAKLGEQGIDFNLDDLKGRDIEEVLECLCEANIDIKGGKDTIRVYCE